ncbi:protein IQ-DOMAIN 11 isoform X4 [Silene latifolia]|uniref:protein IQ-DOMAIN 11 isoform X4 n=1 Tax=Silene latifolia TaxID=37657 RepID=UPI003D773A6C
MSKKRSWFCFIKKLFFQDSHNHQHKCKRRRWTCGRVRRTNRGLLPSPPTESVKTSQQFTETVKINDPEEVQNPIMTECKNDVSKCRDILKDEANIFSFTAMIRIHVQHQAATKIQTAYRAHLTMEIQFRRDRRSDCDLLTKDEEIDSILRKKEAIVIKRQRIRAHSFNHRISTDSEEGNSDGRLKYWLKQYVNDQLDTNEEKIIGKQPKTRNIEDLHNYDTVSGPRRSLQNHKKQSFYKEDSLHPSSPTSLPTYMAATKSAKAKTRSLSSPRLRSIHFEGYSDGDSPYKQKLSPMSSINSEGHSAVARNHHGA